MRLKLNTNTKNGQLLPPIYASLSPINSQGVGNRRDDFLLAVLRNDTYLRWSPDYSGILSNGTHRSSAMGAALVMQPRRGTWPSRYFI